LITEHRQMASWHRKT